MRRLELIAQEHPDKTGQELLQIQQKEIEKEEVEINKRHQKIQKFMDDINKNGGYFRGYYGYDMYYLYKVTNAHYEGNDPVIDVESIYAHIKSKQGNIVPDTDIQFTFDIKKDELFNTYALHNSTRITEKEWMDTLDLFQQMNQKVWLPYLKKLQQIKQTKHEKTL